MMETLNVKIATEVKADSVLLGKFPLHTNETHCLPKLNENPVNFVLCVEKLTEQWIRSFPAKVFADISINCGYESQKHCIWDGEFRLNHNKDIHDLCRDLLNERISFFIDLQVMQENSSIELYVVLNNSAFSPVENPADCKQVTLNFDGGCKLYYKYLFQYLFNLKDDCIQFELPYVVQKKSIEELYEYIQQCCLRKFTESEHLLAATYQHPSLLPSIRNYQARAVHWMYSRENQEQTNADVNGIHPLWQEIHCEDGSLIYLQVYSGKVSREIPKPDIIPRGGILADEMGLGKTVEILSLHLCNQKPQRFQIVEAEHKDCLEKSKSFEHVNYSSNNCALKRPLLFSQTEEENCDNECSVPVKLQKLADEDIHENITCNTPIVSRNDFMDSRTKFKAHSCAGIDKNIIKLSTTALQPSFVDRESGTVEKDVQLTLESISDACEMESLNLGGGDSLRVDPVFEDVQLTLQSILDSCEKEVGMDSSPETENRVLTDQCRQKHCPMYSTRTNKKKFFQDVTNCFICSNAVETDKVCCYLCSNVMHEKCAGYDMKKILRHECPHCAMKDIVDSHCTLIVCPDALQKQWHEEIMKHIKEGEMRVMVYLGVKHHTFLQPKLLAEYDLIITSFNTLRLDFNYAQKASARTLRYKKKYASLPCPLLAINFWRLCIDEAQMVETNNTKLAEMALRIRAVNRWCVTGTPFTRSMNDGYGLLLFLGVAPYYDKLWWKRALYDFYANGDFVPLFEVISQIMWRNCKSDVLDEIQIPKQTEHLSWLQFNAVENHFYQQQFQQFCTSQKADLQRRFPDLESKSLKLSELSKNDCIHSSILSRLLQVRQACVHPSVVRNGYLSMEKKCVTMDQVLERLIDNTKLECEEAHRKLLCALNGLAGIELLKNEFEKAGDYYQEAIDSWNANKDFKTDSLQKLHTLHNLYDIFPMLLEKNNLTVDLRAIAKEKVQLQSDYMSNVDIMVTNNEKEVLKIKQELKDMYSKMNLVNIWWLHVISEATATPELEDQLTNKIVNDFSLSSGFSLSMIRNRFNSLFSLRLTLHQILETIQTVRKNILKSLNKILKRPTKEDVYKSSECCLRPDLNSNAPICLYCVVNADINEYEKFLFSRQNYTDTSGFRSDTDVDTVLKALHSFSKQHAMDLDIIQAGKQHLKYMDTLKKEFKNIRSLFLACYGRVQAIDELDMCTMRLRFPLPGEQQLEGKHHVVKPTEVDTARLTLLSDKLVATTELKSKHGQWLYLQNLSRVQTVHEGYNQEPCPICVIPFGVEWAVFRCGHCLCCRCVVRLQNQRTAYFHGPNNAIRCPICRVIIRPHDVSFVITKQKKIEGFDAHIAVNGYHSTKIEAIVRRVLWIQETDKGAKILVFSTWKNVLQLISQALTENNVLHKHFDRSNKHAQASLETFKRSHDYNVLLLCLHSGSKGLNIIEATHVILSEPALNPGDELQAVGRVHRIGQSKETYVHRFLVKGTIEEKMFNLLKDKSKNHNIGSTDAELTIGDLSVLFKPDENEEHEFEEEA